MILTRCSDGQKRQAEMKPVRVSKDNRRVMPGSNPHRKGLGDPKELAGATWPPSQFNSFTRNHLGDILAVIMLLMCGIAYFMIVVMWVVATCKAAK